MHRTGRPCRPPPRPGRPPPPAPAAGISHFKDGRWGSRQALARGHRVSPAATAPAVVRALGDVPGCGRTAAGGSSAARGSRRSTGTLEGFFSAHGAALLCDGCSGAQLWATAFLGDGGIVLQSSRARCSRRPRRRDRASSSSPAPAPHCPSPRPLTLRLPAGLFAVSASSSLFCPFCDRPIVFHRRVGEFFVFSGDQSSGRQTRSTNIPFPLRSFSAHLPNRVFCRVLLFHFNEVRFIGFLPL